MKTPVLALAVALLTGLARCGGVSDAEALFGPIPPVPQLFTPLQGFDSCVYDAASTLDCQEAAPMKCDTVPTADELKAAKCREPGAPGVICCD